MGEGSAAPGPPRGGSILGGVQNCDPANQPTNQPNDPACPARSVEAAGDESTAKMELAQISKAIRAVEVQKALEKRKALQDQIEAIQASATGTSQKRHRK